MLESRSQIITLKACALQALKGLGVGQKLTKDFPGTLGSIVKQLRRLSFEDVDILQEEIRQPPTLQKRNISTKNIFCPIF